MVLDRLEKAACSYGMKFAPSKCKVLLQDWPSSPPTLSLAGIQLSCVNSFMYLGSNISIDSSSGNEVNSRISKARVAFAGLKHLWSRKDVSLQVKGRI